MRYSKAYIEEIKQRIPGAAFALFSQYGIEAVSMQQVADASNVGVATLYRYYGTKLHLVIDVCARQWQEFSQGAVKIYNEMGGENFTAYEELQFYLNAYIYLYQNRKDLLKFNSNFDLYIQQEKATQEDLKPYYEAIQFSRDFFHRQFIKAYEDHTIRTDIKEQDVYLGIMYAMSSAAAKYSYGAIFPEDQLPDYTFALDMQKRAYLRYMRKSAE